MATEKTFYPSKIKGTTGRNKSKSIQTQEIINAQNLCSKNTSLASWGEYTPSKCGSSNPQRWWCNTLTTKSGSYDHPEQIYVDEWNISDTIANDMIIKSIKIEYAYGLAKYKGWGSPRIETKPTFTLKKSGKTIGSATGNTPKIISNIKSGSLPSYSVSLKQYPNTIGDLRKTKLYIKCGGNVATEIGRLLMQYVRIVVKYDDPSPKYTISLGDNITQKVNTSYTCTCTIGNSNNYNKDSICYIQIPIDTTITNAKFDNKNITLKLNKKVPNEYELYQYTISKKGKITFDLKHSTTGTKTIKAWLSKYCSTTATKKVTVIKTNVDFDFIAQINKNNTWTDITTDTTEVYDDDGAKIRFKCKIKRDAKATKSENLFVSAEELITNWATQHSTIHFTKNTNNEWIINQKFPATTDYIEYVSAETNLNHANVYNVIAKYNDEETGLEIKKNYKINVLSHPLKKENFKIRLEDGTDVQYNSLSFSRGDDLTIPLVYTTEDATPIKDSDLIINGETKRIPLDEIQYIKFNISVTKKDINLENVLTYIDIYDKDTGEKCNDILKGISDNAILLESDDQKYCLIKNLSTQEDTILKLAVSSDTIRECIIKIKPYNYDLYSSKWNPAHVLFDDYPNVKIFIKGDNDILSQDTLTLYYYIENQSDVDGHDLRFQLKEPTSFEKLIVNHSDTISFNPKTRIITIQYLPAHSEQHIIEAQYKATKKGYYDFVISTLDDPNVLNDDQVPNSYTHNVMVDIVSEVKVKTRVSHTKPYVGDLIDFEIDFKNYYKPQKKFTFNISDIGDYNPIHNSNDYIIKRIDCEDGIFTESTNSSTNQIGTWTIDNVETNKDYKLILTLEPNAIGVHAIKTQFLDPQNYEQTFTNRVKVIERRKEIAFNVYHAVSDNNADCSNIDELTPICDDDFITLSDNIYYVFEITNNNRAPLNQPVNIYARLPSSFLENGILCSSIDNYVIDEASNLIGFSLDKLAGCETNPTTKFAIKIKPSQTGKYVSNFMLSTRNSNVLHKQLKLTVDSEFDKRELEHEITIYNFEKTNRHYRYEIDNNGEIFKFFNQGDKTIRPIQTETYNKNAIERYRGKNIKDIVRQIQEKSQYVEPELLRIGANKLKDKGYELCPDGFIRRFGLLNSEVFHETGQLPNISNLGDRVMKWNIDDWNTKVWAGDKYNNGMFELSIDYDKVPTNFIFPIIDNPMAKLQHIVDKTKPYGTKAICYYAGQSEINLEMNIKDVMSEIQYETPIDLKIDDINVLTTKYKHDNTIQYYNDNIYVDLSLDTRLLSEYYLNSLIHYESEEEEYIEDENDNLSMNVETAFLLYDDTINKQYIDECFDIIKNIYYNDNQNIDIVMPYIELKTTNEPRFPTLNKSQIINCTNNHEINKLIGYEITYKDNKVEFGYIEKKDFKGFVVIENDNIISQRYVDEDVTTFNIQSQTIDTDNNGKIIHFWGRINDGDYYHIGFAELEHLTVSTINRTRNGDTNTNSLSYIPEIISTAENATYSWTQQKQPIIFKLSNRNKVVHEKFDYITEVNSGKWSGLRSINNNKYAYFDYKSNIDPQCSDTVMDIPKLLLKYNNINIDNLNEVTDIQFKIKAQSNKDDFMKDLKINILKDGDYYVPNNGVTRKVYYPNDITNNKQELLANIIIKQPNISICADCVKTFLGYYDECPHCHSRNISHHDKVEPVTLCYHCGGITKGTYNYCKHCLSQEVENVEVDYNKTYCNHCGAISNDYYKYCPQCFSPDTVYIDNKRQVYQISDASKQNIDPIIINSTEQSINILNATLPFNKDNILDLKNLSLNIHVTNNNEGKYYYCPDCKHGGLDNFDRCPYCHSADINNYQMANPTLRAHLKIDNDFSQNNLLPNNTIQYGTTVKTLELYDTVKNISNENCLLLLYVDNNAYNTELNKILSLPIDDKYINKILTSVNKINIEINNLSLDYEFTNNKDWIGLSNLQGENHTYIKYNIDNDKDTDTLKFKNFNIPTDYYDKIILNIEGLCKVTNPFGINIECIQNGTSAHKRVTQYNDIFNKNIDITDIVNNYINDIEIIISFDNLDNADEIYITSCNITVEKNTNKDNIKYTKMTDTIFNVEDFNNNYYLLKSNDIWTLKNQAPFFLSSEQLNTGLVCYLDFGELKSSEYIKLYNIDMIIYYKTKYGKITTDSIISLNEDNTEYYITGQVNKNNGEFWTSVNDDDEGLNNLESEDLNVDEDGNIINSIPLYKKLSQSFIYSTSSNISRITLGYDGQQGYPSEFINIYLCDDNDNNPNNIIFKSKIDMSINKKGNINIDVDVNNLTENEQYWIVLEDNNANRNNYHKFTYNNNTNTFGTSSDNIGEGNKVGNLIIEKFDGATLNEQQTLSFSIDSLHNKAILYNLPSEFSDIYIDNENDSTPTEYEGQVEELNSENEYKISNTFYRFNTNPNNNVSLSNFTIKNGRYLDLNEDED